MKTTNTIVANAVAAKLSVAQNADILPADKKVIDAIKVACRRDLGKIRDAINTICETTSAASTAYGMMDKKFRKNLDAIMDEKYTVEVALQMCS